MIWDLGWFNIVVGACIAIFIGLILLMFGNTLLHWNDKCLETQRMAWLQPILVGKITILMPMSSDVCVKWESAK